MYQTQIEQKIERTIDGRRCRVKAFLRQSWQQVVGSNRFVIGPHQLQYALANRSQSNTFFLTQIARTADGGIYAGMMIVMLVDVLAHSVLASLFAEHSPRCAD